MGILVILGIILIILGFGKIADAPYGGFREAFPGIIMIIFGTGLLSAIANI